MSDTRWWSGWVKCRICSDVHVSVIETDRDMQNLEDTECPNCHCMACDPAETWELEYRVLEQR